MFICVVQCPVTKYQGSSRSIYYLSLWQRSFYGERIYLAFFSLAQLWNRKASWLAQSKQKSLPFEPLGNLRLFWPDLHFRRRFFFHLLWNLSARTIVFVGETRLTLTKTRLYLTTRITQQEQTMLITCGLLNKFYDIQTKLWKNCHIFQLDLVLLIYPCQEWITKD